MLENHGFITHYIYKDCCKEIKGKLSKDVSKMGRDMTKVIIMDDYPLTYILEECNDIPVRRYYGSQGAR
jgi:TFIIF-interacting CTD phosphatase-like protein